MIIDDPILHISGRDNRFELFPGDFERGLRILLDVWFWRKREPGDATSFPGLSPTRPTVGWVGENPGNEESSAFTGVARSHASANLFAG